MAGSPITAKAIGRDAQSLVRALKAQSAGAKDRTLNQIGREMKQDFDELVSNWKDKPRFKVVRTPETVSVTTSDEVFGFVNAGTRPHIIRPKRSGGLLKYRLGYRAKTRPNNTTYKGSGTASGPWRSSKLVHHPGTKARNFTRIIANRWKKEGARLLRAELKKRR